MSNQATVAQLQPQPIQPTRQVSAAGPRATIRHQPEAAKRPRWIWRVVDWKYNVDESSKRLKKLYFRFVFLPFNEFSYWIFDLLPPNKRDKNGELCWIEDQGYYEDEWQGHQEAAKYRFGHCIRVPLNAALPADTVNTEQIHPNSTPEVRKMYEGKTVEPTIPVQRLDVVRLAAKIAQSDRLFQSKVV